MHRRARRSVRHLKTISSFHTFIMKVLFPAVWIGGFGFGTLSLWRGTAELIGGGVPPPEMKWIFLCIWLLGTGFLLWGCVGLKKVRMDSTNLYISNYLRELVVPFSNVSDVTEDGWVNIHPITIQFKTPTDFGQRIKFMPKSRVFALSDSHPIVSELRGRITAGRV